MEHKINVKYKILTKECTSIPTYLNHCELYKERLTNVKKC